MAEGIKACFTVITSHAAFTDSAKGKVGRREMNNRVVDATTAMGDTGKNVFFVCFAGCEEIESQRFRSRIHLLYNILQIFKLQYRKQRTEDFFLHDWAFPRNIVKNGRFNPIDFRIRLTTAINVPAFHQTQEPLKMLFIHNLWEFLFIRLAEEFRDVFGHACKELFFHSFLYKHIVWSDAGLAGIDEFAPNDALGSKINLRSGVDDAGTLSSQFKCHGSEVLGCRLHDKSPDGGTAGEENVIKFLGKQIFVGFPAPEHHRNVFFRKSLAQHFRYYLGGLRGMVGRFQNRAIACSQRPDQRSDRQLEGIIPGGDNQHDAIGFRINH